MIGSGKASDRQESRGDSGVASLSQTQIVRADGGTDTSREDRERRHRILRSLRGQLERHPAVVSARGMPEGNYAEIEADLDPLYFGRDADTSSLRITWHPNPAFPPETGLEDRQRTSLAANFVFHYRESTGFDCGYHLEPNPTPPDTSIIRNETLPRKPTPTMRSRSLPLPRWCALGATRRPRNTPPCMRTTRLSRRR